MSDSFSTDLNLSEGQVDKLIQENTRLEARIAELELNEKDWSDQARQYCERIAEVDQALREILNRQAGEVGVRIPEIARAAVAATDETKEEEK